MLFKARNRESFWKRFRVWAWPRVSWTRSWRYYIKRVIRLSGKPHTVAAGCASGVAVSFTPFIGFHFLFSFVVAFFVRGNMLAAAIGTAAGNPLTFPFIWAATYEVGQFILGAGSSEAPPTLGESLSAISFGNIWANVTTNASIWSIFDVFVGLWPIIKPMLVGSVPLGLASGLITYGIMYKIVSAYQERRRRRVEQLAKEGSDTRDGKAVVHKGGKPKKSSGQEVSGEI